MKHSVLAPVLFAALALAHAHGGAHHHAHHHGKRDGDDGVVTVTSDIWVTTTTTIELPPGATIPAQTEDSASTTAATVAPSVDAASANAAAAPAATSAAQAPAEHLPLPATSQQQQPAAAPSATAAAAPQAPAPQAPAPQAPAPQAPAASSSVASAPAPSQSSTGASDSAPVSGGTSTYLTYYNPGGADGSCGSTLVDSSETVAMSNGKEYCGRQLKITGPGSTRIATVADTCPGCGDGHLDIPEGFATEIAGNYNDMVNLGKVPITWEWV